MLLVVQSSSGVHNRQYLLQHHGLLTDRRLCYVGGLVDNSSSFWMLPFDVLATDRRLRYDGQTMCCDELVCNDMWCLLGSTLFSTNN